MRSIQLDLFKKRTVWCPTWRGWIFIAVALLSPPILWWCNGEAYLSKTKRVAADVFVVEGWIGEEAISAAIPEIRAGDYRFVVTSGGLTGRSWSVKRWSNAEHAANLLERFGIDRDRIIVAEAKEVELGRSYENACAVREVLADRGIELRGINVYTRSVHARRSRVLFEKAFKPSIKMGVIAWIPPEYSARSWRSSSARAEEFIEESLAYGYELLWDSGRSAE